MATRPSASTLPIFSPWGEELHCGARGCQLWRWLVLRRRRHLSPRLAHQDRPAAPGQVGEHGPLHTERRAQPLCRWPRWFRTRASRPRVRRLHWQILDASGKTVATRGSSCTADRRRRGVQPLRRPPRSRIQALVSGSPNLYSAVVTVESGGKARDAEHVSFGVRTAVFDAEKGFFLNGKSIKIQGTCNHQDHAGVGAAVPDRLQWFRPSVLQEMGCNAVRTSHNMPTPEWVEACDRMGMMMMCETRQMSSNPEGLAQLEVMVSAIATRRPSLSGPSATRSLRCRPRWRSRAQRLPRAMVRRCHELDPTRVVSAAVNGDNKQGVADAARYHRIQLQPEVSRRLSQEAIRSGRSLGPKLQALSQREASTLLIRCEIP